MIEAPETAVDRPGPLAEPSPARNGSMRWLAAAAVLGGALWIMWAALDATSSGESDLGNLSISIRLFLILPSVALIAAGSIGLARQQPDAPRPWLVSALVGAAMLFVGTAFDLWQIRFIGLVGLLVGSFALAIRAFRVRAMPRWTALLLAVGCVVMILGDSEGSGPWLWTGFGAGWIAAGYALWVSAPKVPFVQAPAPILRDFEPEQERAAPSRAPIRPVLTLARVEGRRMLTNPVFLLSPLLGLGVIGGLAAQATDRVAVLAVSGFGFFTVGWGALLAANLGALRSRRHHTEELYATTPLSARSRTAAHVIGLAWPVGAALALNLAAAVYLQTRGPVPLETDFGPAPEPFSFALLQGPALVALFGALGLLLARWVPSVTAAPPAIVATFMLEMPFLWSNQSGRWLAPLVMSAKPSELVHVMGLHVVYLFGLAVLLGSIATLRSGRTRITLALAAGGAAAAVAGGVLQILAA